jgi:DNA repair protein NreA
MISDDLCIRCKGKLLCNLKVCPLIRRSNNFSKLKSLIKNDSFSGSSPPGVFVSWVNYPKVAVSPLSLIGEKNEICDSPENWYGLDQEKIISFRENLFRSFKLMPVSLASNPNYDLISFQELIMSKNTLDVEVNLSSKIKDEVSFDSFSAPVGPSAKLKNLSFSNVGVLKKLEKYYYDTSALSSTALIDLYENGFKVSLLSKFLSLGSIGLKNKRKIVPTRWSITAVDNNISKYLIDEKLVDGKMIDSFRIFHSNYLDNSFYILLLPTQFSFEQFESWSEGAYNNSSEVILSDFELFKGLKKYPVNTQGAYFASRLAVTDYLSKRKETAGAIVFREIGPNYLVPLGVWQVRENVKAALNNEFIEVPTLDLALSYLKDKLKVDIEEYVKKSKLIELFKNQKKLSDWF